MITCFAIIVPPKAVYEIIHKIKINLSLTGQYRGKLLMSREKLFSDTVVYLEPVFFEYYEQKSNDRYFDQTIELNNMLNNICTLRANEYGTDMPEDFLLCIS